MSTDMMNNFIKKYFVYTRLGLDLTKHHGNVGKDIVAIQKNRKYKNIHNGQRCFILGNGPSIKKERLDALRNEVVFVVNQATKTSFYEKLKPKYFVCVDPVFFNLNSSNDVEKQVVESFENLYREDNSPICFIPARFKNGFVSIDIAAKLNINYFVDSFKMTDNYRWEMDYSKVVPAFGTVVQYALTLAIYMGFNEIYLLGCDNTGIIATVNSILKNNMNDMYAYAIGNDEKERMEKMVTKNGLEEYCKSYLYTLQDYRRLYHYCNERGIKLINCSSSSVIDSIPKMSLQCVLNDKLF